MSGGYSYGMILTMLAGGPLADTMGGKWVLLTVVLVSSICTMLVPLLTSVSSMALILVQVVSGNNKIIIIHVVNFPNKESLPLNSAESVSSKSVFILCDFVFVCKI